MADINATQGQNNEFDKLRFAIPEKGYGVYLKGILPEDQRVLAGAFSTSMQQIKNVEQLKLDKFAQVVYSTENMFGLNLVNGTDVPSDVRLARIAQTICALGGGVYGTYTMSNFFGCMSGLPYPLTQIYDGIKQLETEKLKKIYQELYLAVKWEQASPSVTVTKPTYAVQNGDTGAPDYLPLYDYYYTITNATWAGTAGGGYGRGAAPAPTGIISGGSGATVETKIDTTPENVPGSYGQVIKVTLVSAGSPVMYSSGNLSPTPTSPPATPVELEAPPTNYTIYPYTGLSNTPYGTDGWLTMNSVVQSLIDDSNNEIQDISVANAGNFDSSNILNTNWVITGKALKQEQRARYISAAPVPSPEWDQWLANYPTSMYIFTDAIPILAGNTLPHMYAQTLEHISNLNLVGGQSVIGMMRESRNDERLSAIGSSSDNNLANDLDDDSKEQLLVNNTLPGAMEDEGINGYTIPAFPGQTPTGDIIQVPVSYYDPCVPGGGLMCYDEFQYIENDATQAILEAPPPEEEIPFDELPETPEGYEPPPEPEILESDIDAAIDLLIPDTSFPCEGIVVEPMDGIQPAPVAATIIGVGPSVLCDPPTDYPLGVNALPTVGGGRPIVPPELDAQLIASTLTPSVPTVQQAIDQVIKCNCDCWVA